MTLTLDANGGTKTTIIWRMLFETADECAKVRVFAVDANEQNLDRLEAGLARMRKAGEGRLRHVSRHQDALQLQAAGHRRRDPRLVAAIRPQAEWLHAALACQRRGIRAGGRPGGARRTPAHRLARHHGAGTRP